MLQRTKSGGINAIEMQVQATAEVAPSVRSNPNPKSPTVCKIVSSLASISTDFALSRSLIFYLILSDLRSQYF